MLPLDPDEDSALLEEEPTTALLPPLGCGRRDDDDGGGADTAEGIFLTAAGLYCVRVGTFPLVSAASFPLLVIRAACSLQKLMCLSAAFSLNLL